MLLDRLKKITKKEIIADSVGKLFLRNLLKESLQYYVLDYVYSSAWGSSFLFKGGTCLRFCFGLPRLSEDLDFDIKNYKEFNLKKFCQSLSDYFIKKLQFKEFGLKVAKNNQQVYLKFPLMDQLGLKENNSESPILFLRLDLNPVDSNIYQEEISLITDDDFNFIIKRYALTDLFASKLAAILERTFKKGKGDIITFKGRDYFDLIWFLQKNIKPNFLRLENITGVKKNQLIKKIDNKVNQINLDYLKEDLLPLFRKRDFVNSFCNSFSELYQTNKNLFNTF